MRGARPLRRRRGRGRARRRAGPVPTTTFLAPAALTRLLAAARRDPAALRRPAAARPCRIALSAGPQAGRPWSGPAPVRVGVLRLDRGPVHGLLARGVARTTGHRGPGPARAGPCRSTTTATSGAGRPAFARFAYWRDAAKTAAAWRDGAFTVGRPRAAGRRRLPVPRRPARRPGDHRRGQRLPGRGGGVAGRGGRRRGGGRVRAARRPLGPAGLRRRGPGPAATRQRVLAAVADHAAGPPGRLQAAQAVRGGRRAAPHGHRQGPAAAAAGRCSAWSDRPTGRRGSGPGHRRYWTPCTPSIPDLPSPPSIPPPASCSSRSSPTTPPPSRRAWPPRRPAAPSGRPRTFDERSRLLVTAAELLEGEVPDIAHTVTTEMGKPFAQAKGEVAKCAHGFRWFAEHAEGMLADREVPVDGSLGLVAYQPLGVGPGHHAVELPAVAGGPVHRPGRHGRQRGPAQARPERAPHGPAARGPVPPGRRARRRASRRCWSAPTRCRPSSPTTGWPR